MSDVYYLGTKTIYNIKNTAFRLKSLRSFYLRCSHESYLIISPFSNICSAEFKSYRSIAINFGYLANGIT